MKMLMCMLLSISLTAAFSQNTDIRGKRVIADNGLFIKDRWVDSVKNNISNITVNQERTLMTTKAVLDLFNSGAAALEVFQYEDNVNVNVVDSTTILVLNKDQLNTANRIVTLKDPLQFSRRTIKLLNYNTGSFSYSTPFPFINLQGQETTALLNSTLYTFASDGDKWVATSQSSLPAPGSTPGGSSGVELINLD